MLHRPGPKEPILLENDHIIDFKGFINFGPEIDMRDFTILTAYLKLVIGDATDVQIRALAKNELGRTDLFATPDDPNMFLLPIKTTSASVSKVEPHYYEFNVDADQNMILEWVSNAGFPYVQLQARCMGWGVTPGLLSGFYLKTSYNSLA